MNQHGKDYHARKRIGEASFYTGVNERNIIMKKTMMLFGGFIVAMVLLVSPSQAGVTISNTWVQTPSTVNFDGSDYYTHTVTVSSDIGAVEQFGFYVESDCLNGDMSQIHLDGMHTVFNDKTSQDYNDAGYDILQDTHLLVSWLEITSEQSGHYSDGVDVFLPNGQLAIEPFQSKALLQVVIPKASRVWIDCTVYVDGISYSGPRGQLTNELSGGLVMLPEPCSFMMVGMVVPLLLRRR